MSDFERTLTVKADVNAVYQFLSDVNNMPKYLPTLQHADKPQGDKVHVTGDVHGQHYDSHGYFHADPASHRLEWGSEGDHHYSGWMTLKPGDATGDLTEITMHLHFEKLPPMPHGDPDDAMLDGMQRALEAIRDHVARKSGGVV